MYIRDVGQTHFTHQVSVALLDTLTNVGASVDSSDKFHKGITLPKLGIRNTSDERVVSVPQVVDNPLEVWSDFCDQPTDKVLELEILLDSSSQNNPILLETGVYKELWRTLKSRRRDLRSVFCRWIGRRALRAMLCSVDPVNVTEASLITDTTDDEGMLLQVWCGYGSMDSKPTYGANPTLVVDAFVKGLNVKPDVLIRETSAQPFNSFTWTKNVITRHLRDGSRSKDDGSGRTLEFCPITGNCSNNVLGQKVALHTVLPALFLGLIG